MTKAKVVFRECLQNSQEYGSNDEHMVSRIFFDYEIAGKMHEGVYVDVKQTVGSSFDTSPLEVGSPVGYSGPLNYIAFRDGVERYYRGLVGAQGSGIHVTGGSNIRMQNNRFVKSETIEFDVDIPTRGW